MKAILVNYNFRPEWLKEYDFEYTIFDRSDDPKYLQDFGGEIIKTQNIGNVDYDKLTYLVDNYDNLPDVFLWGKTNLLKYTTKNEFDELLSTPNLGFAPILTKQHRTYSDYRGTVNYYDDDGMYCERNDSWFLGSHPAKYFETWNQWAREFELPTPEYIPFAPGGNYILTKERVHKYPKNFYDHMRLLMNYTQLPGEAQCAERSYYLMWK